MAIVYCEYCNRPFQGRKDAKTCSNACRVAKHKKEQRMKHFTVQGMTPHHRVILEMLKVVSMDIHRQMMDKLSLEGATVVEKDLDMIIQFWSCVRAFDFNGSTFQIFDDMCNHPDFVPGAKSGDFQEAKQIALSFQERA